MDPTKNRIAEKMNRKENNAMELIWNINHISM